MKVFLTGANGFIGSWTLRFLIANRYHVRICLRKGAVIDNIREYLDKVEVFWGDLTDVEFVKMCISGCDAVIHLAGKIVTLISSKRRDEVISSNYMTTLNVFSESLKAGVKKVVFLGSIFGLGKGRGMEFADESVKFNLERLQDFIPYVRAKRMAEILADNFYERGLPVVRVYPNYCLGEGDIYLSSSKAILPFVLGMKFYFDMGINIQWVGDAARSLIIALEKGKEGEKYLVGGENLTMEEIAIKVNAILGRPDGVERKLKRVDPKYFRLLFYLPKFLLEFIEDNILKKYKIDLGMIFIATEKYWFYSDRKARKELGYTSRSLDEVLEEAVNWLKNFVKSTTYRKVLA